MAGPILPDNEAFNEAIPRPEAELGWQVGEWNVRPEQITRCLPLKDQGRPTVNRQRAFMMKESVVTDKGY